MGSLQLAVRRETEVPDVLSTALNFQVIIDRLNDAQIFTQIILLYLAGKIIRER